MVVAGCLATVAAGAQSTSVVAGAIAPVGDFAARAAGTGYGFALRQEIQLSRRMLAIRVDAGISHVNGKALVQNYDFQTMGVNLVHYEHPAFYEFGGISLVSSATKSAGSPGTLGRAVTRSGTALGAQLGVGLTVDIFKFRPIIEVGIVTVHAAGGYSTWVPVRVGIGL